MITKIIGGNVMKVKNDINAFNGSQWLQSQVLIKISLTNSSNERAKPREIILNFKVNGWGSGDPSVEPPTVVRQKFFVSLALCNYQRRRHGLSQIDLMSPSLQASADPRALSLSTSLSYTLPAGMVESMQFAFKKKKSISCFRWLSNGRKCRAEEQLNARLNLYWEHKMTSCFEEISGIQS
jgi:hypothetical protein